MLATKWLEHKDHLMNRHPTLYVSAKLDGIRCVATKNGLYSRLGVRFDSCGHVLDAAQSMLRSMEKNHSTSRGWALDGELYIDIGQKSIDQFCFDSVVTAVKKQSTKATSEDLKLQATLKFHVFDVIDLASPTRLPFVDRRDIISDYVPRRGSGPLSAVEQTKVKSEEELERSLDNYLNKDYEGLVVRTLDGKYEIGRRSKSLLKYVPVMEQEFSVYGTVAHTRLPASLGTLICATPNGRKFTSDLIVDDATRRKWWTKRHELIGKKATVRFQRLTSAGVPRFPKVKSIRNFMKMRV